MCPMFSVKRSYCPSLVHLERIQSTGFLRVFDLRPSFDSGSDQRLHVIEGCCNGIFQIVDGGMISHRAFGDLSRRARRNIVCQQLR